MTTTEHLLANDAIYGVRCSCGYVSTFAALTRHLLDVGRDEGRQEGYDAARANRELMSGAVDWMQGYDAGRAAAKGKLVAADDPRVKKQGARARLELVHPPSRKSEAYEGIVTHDVMGRPVVCGCLLASPTVGAVYLLAEAPDPDAEARAALASVMGNGDPVSSDDLRSADDLLAALRVAGFDVVKAVAK